MEQPEKLIPNSVTEFALNIKNTACDSSNAAIQDNFNTFLQLSGDFGRFDVANDDWMPKRK